MNPIALATKYFGPVPVLPRLTRLRQDGLSVLLEVTGRYYLAELAGRQNHANSNIS